MERLVHGGARLVAQDATLPRRSTTLKREPSAQALTRTSTGRGTIPASMHNYRDNLAISVDLLCPPWALSGALSEVRAEISRVDPGPLAAPPAPPPARQVGAALQT
eukprot:5530971-Pyramimonas_sp.AAC.1